MNWNFLLLLLLSILIIVVEIFYNKNNNIIIKIFSFLFYFFFLFYLLLEFLNLNNFKIFLLFLINLIFILIINTLKNNKLDLIFLNFIVLLGASIIILSDNLIWIYLGLEIQTFSIFILITQEKNYIKNLEAGLKYFILGGLSSGLFLLGITFLIKFDLSLNLNLLNHFFFNNNNFFKLGYLLIILSFLFKLSLFPFYFWIPDIYEGSHLNVLSLISTIPKISLISLIIKLNNFEKIIIICSIFSIIIGTFGALNQTKLKRLLAYSGISHFGFILLGISLYNNLGYESSLIYLVIYIFNLLPLFILLLFNKFNKNFYIIELSEIYNNSKILGLSLIVIVFSITGLPPFLGFLGKWLIIWNLYSFNYYISCIIAILFSVISAGYYIRLIRLIIIQKNSSFITWKKVLNINSYFYNILIFGFFIYFISFFLINPNPLILSVFWGYYNFF